MIDSRARYVTTALLLGGATFALLALLRRTSDAGAMGLLSLFACFLATSLWVAIQFRRQIGEAKGFRLVSTGIVLMYVWAFGCAMLMVVLDLAEHALGIQSGLQLSENPGIGNPEHPFIPLFIALPFGALLSVSSLFFITIPMGIAFVAILRWAGRPRNAR